MAGSRSDGGGDGEGDAGGNPAGRSDDSSNAKGNLGSALIRQSGKDVKQIIAELNPVLRGWGNYFRTGNADQEFNKLDGFVFRRMRRWQFRRGGQRVTSRRAWTGDQLHGMGLYRLRGTVCYPTQATSIRSSVSCVRENRTHSLKGGYMETGQR
jgi:Group II intron, maturase-specific domain